MATAGSDTALAALDWGEYELLDSGSGAKLERFGEVLLQRPSPQALWNPRRPAEEWDRAAGRYHRSPQGGGDWEGLSGVPEEWWIGMGGLRLRIQPTGFGHLGVFAEQLPFWSWIQARCAEADDPPSVLNLFAYTGGASLAAARGGARVTHCDASRGIVQWASRNAQANGFEQAREDGAEIRWIVEDAWKFVAREKRRGNRYDAVVLDPPSFGRGPKGQVWKLERDLTRFLSDLRSLLSDTPRFLLLSAHTPGIGPVGLRNLLEDALEGLAGSCSAGEMVIPEGDGRRHLPSGTWAAWSARGELPRGV